MTLFIFVVSMKAVTSELWTTMLCNPPNCLFSVCLRFDEKMQHFSSYKRKTKHDFFECKFQKRCIVVHIVERVVALQFERFEFNSTFLEDLNECVHVQKSN